jgi:hypothetical protein
VNTQKIKTAAAVVGMTAGLVAAAPVTASAATARDATTTNPAVTAPPLQSATATGNVQVNVDTVNQAFHGTVPSGSVQGSCGITSHFMQGQGVVFRMWGTGADGTPLTGPNATNGGTVASAVVNIQLPGGGTKTVNLSYGQHGSGATAASFWTGLWSTSTATPTGTVNYTVTVQTYDVPPVTKTVDQTTVKVVYKKVPRTVYVKVHGRRHAVKIKVRKAFKHSVTTQVQQVVTPGIPGPTGTFSSSASLVDSPLTIIATGTPPTSW